MTPETDAPARCRACGSTAGEVVLDLGRPARRRPLPAGRRPGPRPRPPAADVAVRRVRPGAAADRPHHARGATGRRARRPRRPGGRRRRPGRGRRLAAGGRRRRRVRQPARRLVAGSAGRPGADRGRRRGAGRRRARLLRADARRRPGGGDGRAGRPDGAGRRPAAAVPLAGHDRAARAVELPAPRPLRLLLDHGARAAAGVGGPGPPVRRGRFDLYCGHGPARGHPHGRRAVGAGTAASRPCWPTSGTCGVDDPERLRHLQDATPSPTPRRCGRGSRASGRPAARCSATAPPRGRWRCCAARASTAPCLAAVADASPAKQGRRMPATDVPVVAPADAGGGPSRTRSPCSCPTCCPRCAPRCPRSRRPAGLGRRGLPGHRLTAYESGLGRAGERISVRARSSTVGVYSSRRSSLGGQHEQDQEHRQDLGALPGEDAEVADRREGDHEHDRVRRRRRPRTAPGRCTGAIAPAAATTPRTARAARCPRPRR